MLPYFNKVAQLGKPEQGKHLFGSGIRFSNSEGPPLHLTRFWMDANDDD